MKNLSEKNRALEGIHIGDDMDGFFTVDRGKPSGAFVFNMNHGLGARLKRNDPDSLPVDISGRK